MEHLSHTQKTTPMKLIVAVSGASGSIYAFHLLRALYSYDGETHLVVSDSALKVLQYEGKAIATYYENFVEKNTSKDLSQNTSTHPFTTPEDYLNFCLFDMDPQIQKHQFHIQNNKDIGASIASGSNKIDAMVVVPCSMKTVAGISHSYASNLIERAADVCIKEKRPLVLVPRETPLHSIHLENMLKLSRIGVHIVPASPGFYHSPAGIDDLGKFMSGKILNLLNIPHTLFEAWDPSK